MHQCLTAQCIVSLQQAVKGAFDSCEQHNVCFKMYRQPDAEGSQAVAKLFTLWCYTACLAYHSLILRGSDLSRHLKL